MMEWFYGPRGATLFVALVAILIVSALIVLAHIVGTAPVVPVHHNVIHSGIGNALCTQSYICEREF